MLTVWIDAITPCLKDVATGAIIETEVLQVKRKSFLSHYNKKTGWSVNWSSLADENDIYALVIKGTADIQGLVAVTDTTEAGLPYIAWMTASPDNNPLLVEKKRFDGIGGHLFAIAADYSCRRGYDGAFYGFAMDGHLEQHYISVLGAEHIGMLHPYHIVINPQEAKKLMEVYTYEWTDEII